jgi:Ca2+-binding RTX toxin-like protein
LTNGQPLPAWLTFDSATRTFSGTPAARDAGIAGIVLQATDSGGLSNAVEFNISALTTITLTGTSGNDTLSAVSAANHQIYGLDGNDILVGNAGDDRIEGGTGTDTLDGGAGDDTYVYARGDGFDTISQQDSTTGKIDTLLLRSGINPTNLLFASDANNRNLAIRFRDPDGSVSSADSITVYDALAADTDEAKIDQILFEDAPGTVLTIAEVEALAMTPTEGNDYIRGTNGADQISALSGYDVVDAQDGDDQVSGGAGPDTLNGGGGDDLLIGGPGDDDLTGGGGSDTYQINRRRERRYYRYVGYRSGVD